MKSGGRPKPIIGDASATLRSPSSHVSKNENFLQTAMRNLKRKPVAIAAFAKVGTVPSWLTSTTTSARLMSNWFVKHGKAPRLHPKLAKHMPELEQLTTTLWSDPVLSRHHAKLTALIATTNKLLATSCVADTQLDKLHLYAVSVRHEVLFKKRLRDDIERLNQKVPGWADAMKKAIASFTGSQAKEVKEALAILSKAHTSEITSGKDGATIDGKNVFSELRRRDKLLGKVLPQLFLRARAEHIKTKEYRDHVVGQAQHARDAMKLGNLQRIALDLRSGDIAKREAALKALSAILDHMKAGPAVAESEDSLAYVSVMERFSSKSGILGMYKAYQKGMGRLSLKGVRSMPLKQNAFASSHRGFPEHPAIALKKANDRRRLVERFQHRDMLGMMQTIVKGTLTEEKYRSAAAHTRRIVFPGLKVARGSSDPLKGYTPIDNGILHGSRSSVVLGTGTTTKTSEGELRWRRAALVATFLYELKRTELVHTARSTAAEIIDAKEATPKDKARMKLIVSQLDSMPPDKLMAALPTIRFWTQTTAMRIGSERLIKAGPKLIKAADKINVDGAAKIGGRIAPAARKTLEAMNKAQRLFEAGAHLKDPDAFKKLLVDGQRQMKKATAAFAKLADKLDAKQHRDLMVNLGILVVGTAVTWGAATLALPALATRSAIFASVVRSTIAVNTILATVFTATSVGLGVATGTRKFNATECLEEWAWNVLLFNVFGKLMRTYNSLAGKMSGEALEMAVGKQVLGEMAANRAVYGEALTALRTSATSDVALQRQLGKAFVQQFDMANGIAARYGRISEAIYGRVSAGDALATMFKKEGILLPAEVASFATWETAKARMQAWGFTLREKPNFGESAAAIWNPKNLGHMFLTILALRAQGAAQERISAALNNVAVAKLRDQVKADAQRLRAEDLTPHAAAEIIKQQYLRIEIIKAKGGDVKGLYREFLNTKADRVAAQLVKRATDTDPLAQLKHLASDAIRAMRASVPHGTIVHSMKRAMKAGAITKADVDYLQWLFGTHQARHGTKALTNSERMRANSILSKAGLEVDTHNQIRLAHSTGARTTPEPAPTPRVEYDLTRAKENSTPEGETAALGVKRPSGDPLPSKAARAAKRPSSADEPITAKKPPAKHSATDATQPGKKPIATEPMLGSPEARSAATRPLGKDHPPADTQPGKRNRATTETRPGKDIGTVDTKPGRKTSGTADTQPRGKGVGTMDTVSAGNGPIVSATPRGGRESLDVTARARQKFNRILWNMRAQDIDSADPRISRRIRITSNDHPDSEAGHLLTHIIGFKAGQQVVQQSRHTRTVVVVRDKGVITDIRSRMGRLGVPEDIVFITNREYIAGKMVVDAVLEGTKSPTQGSGTAARTDGFASFKEAVKVVTYAQKVKAYLAGKADKGTAKPKPDASVAQHPAVKNLRSLMDGKGAAHLEAFYGRIKDFENGTLAEQPKPHRSIAEQPAVQRAVGRLNALARFRSDRARFETGTTKRMPRVTPDIASVPDVSAFTSKHPAHYEIRGHVIRADGTLHFVNTTHGIVSTKAVDNFWNSALAYGRKVGGSPYAKYIVGGMVFLAGLMTGVPVVLGSIHPMPDNDGGPLAPTVEGIPERRSLQRRASHGTLKFGSQTADIQFLGLEDGQPVLAVYGIFGGYKQLVRQKLAAAFPGERILVLEPNAAITHTYRADEKGIPIEGTVTAEFQKTDFYVNKQNTADGRVLCDVTIIETGAFTNRHAVGLSIARLLRKAYPGEPMIFEMKFKRPTAAKRPAAELPPAKKEQPAKPAKPASEPTEGNIGGQVYRDGKPVGPESTTASGEIRTPTLAELTVQRARLVEIRHKRQIAFRDAHKRGDIATRDEALNRLDRVEMRIRSVDEQIKVITKRGAFESWLTTNAEARKIVDKLKGERPKARDARRLMELVAGQEKLSGALTFVRDLAHRRIDELIQMRNELSRRDVRARKTLGVEIEAWDRAQRDTFKIWVKQKGGKMRSYLQRFENGTADMFDADKLFAAARKEGRGLDALLYIVDRTHELKISNPNTTLWESIYSHYLMVLSNHSANR